jgi:hypothetical protein
VDNDISEVFNGIVIKVKYEHRYRYRENLKAQLIRHYLYVDKNKFLTIAIFWMFFLKIFGLVGKKRGYLSSTTYLLMLINYLQ